MTLDTNGFRVTATAGIGACVAVVALAALWIVAGLSGVALGAHGVWWTVHDAVGNVLAGFYLATLVPAAVGFIAWQRDAIRKASAFGPAVTPGVGWSTAGWFVPVGNLFIPFRSMSSVARASAPAGERPAMTLIRIWWSAWLAAHLSGWLGGTLILVTDRPGAWIAGMTMKFGAAMALIVAGLVALRLIRVVTLQQRRKLHAA